MSTFKTIGRVSASGIFKLSILLLAVLLPIVLVFGTSIKLKSSLQASGIYSTVVDKAIDTAIDKASQEASEQTGSAPIAGNLPQGVNLPKGVNLPPGGNANQGATGKQDNSLPFEQPEIRAAVKKAIPPKQVQTWAEQAIDGLYGWLTSSAANPVLALDFSSTKQNLANALVDYAVTRAQGLPVCTNAQLRALQASGGNIDAFTAVCIPRGFDVASLRTTVQDQVLKNTEVLDKQSFSAADLPKNSEGKTPFEQAAMGRTVFQWTKRAPYILIIVALLTGALLVLLHDKRRRGVFVVSRTLVIVGLLVTITALLERYLITLASSPTGVLVKNVQGDFQSTAIFIVRDLGNSINKPYLALGLTYTFVGVVGLLVLRFTRPNVVAPTSTAADEPVEKQDVKAMPEAANVDGEVSETKGTDKIKDDKK